MRSNIHLYPSDFRSESRIMREARALAGMNIFSHIYLIGACSADLPKREQIDPRITLYRLGPRKERFRSAPARMIWLVCWMGAVLWFCLRHPLACVNAHSLPVLPLAALIKGLKSCYLVYDTHELETETGYSRGLRKRLASFIERRFIRVCDRHVFVGQAIADWYQERYGLTDPMVVYNVPCLSGQIPSDPQGGLRNRLGIAQNQPIALYQGLLGQGRGVNVLLEVAALVPEMAIVFLGFGPLEEQVRNAAAEQANIYFHPRVPPEELLPITKSADFGLSFIEPVSLSYELCMPNKMFEYMHADIPVLVSPTTEQKRLIERFGAGLVACSVSVSDIADCLRLALRADRTALQQGCRAATVHYAWENQVDILRRVHQVLKR
ncbi:glycosyltransferase [Roseicyclus marinus]|uniref:glycosyltransferase n=1 Tax=Roseicyclus marinus TaxID=2161673 RepID=UPI0024107202|nr:glycosyltransferase [Roseicyclus marinus]MDG3042468.1 glycosyltransferase [Roseicyclus marinus]